MSTYYPNSFFERGRGSIYKSPTKSKPKNANEQAARTMKAAGIGSMGGKTTTTAAQKIQDRFRRETQKDSGSTRDEVPQTLTTGLGSKMVEPNMTMEEVDTPNALTKAEKIAEALKAASAAVGLSAPTPTQAYVYDPIKVYEAGMKRPVGSLAYDTMFPTQAMLDAIPGGSSRFTTTWGGRQQPLTVPDLNKFGSSIDIRPFYERLEDPYYSISQGSDVTPDRFNMAGSITAPELAYGKERITPTLPPQAAMGQNIPTMGSPAYSDAAVKSGVDDILLNLAEDYVIESGDTLSDIAKERGTTVEVLQKLNNIPDADKDTIYTGDKLKVPPKDVENIIRVSTRGTSADSGEITSDAIDPDADNYKSFSPFISDKTSKLLKGLEGFEEKAYLGLIQEGKYNSGLTVGAGIDFGQHTEKSLLDMGIPKSMVDKAVNAGWVGLTADNVIDPKTGKVAANRAVGKKILEQKVKTQKANKTFPTFTKEELDQSTPAVYQVYEDAARREYERERNSRSIFEIGGGESPSFDELSEGTKAVLSLEKYHRGVNYDLPSEMIVNAIVDNPIATADSVRDTRRRKNMKDWLKKVDLDSKDGTISSSLRPKPRPLGKP